MASGWPSTLTSLTLAPLLSIAARAPSAPTSLTLKIPARSGADCSMFSVTVSAVSRSCLPFCLVTILMSGYFFIAASKPRTRSRIGTTGMPSRIATLPLPPSAFARYSPAWKPAS